MLIGYKIFLSVLSKVLSKKISTFSQKLSSFTTQRTFQINSQKKSARLTRTWFNRGQGRIPVVTEKQRIKLALHQTSSSSVIMVSVTFWLDEVQEEREGKGRSREGDQDTCLFMFIDNWLRKYQKLFESPQNSLSA